MKESKLTPNERGDFKIWMLDPLGFISRVHNNTDELAVKTRRTN